ncbi:hypothetical protein H70737_10905 [Paenibacillus sp. FSL H7-0737]|nr:hypothetical protein H70737_10905 [Paenibacillus sp. FSL H7-0737]
MIGTNAFKKGNKIVSDHFLNIRKYIVLIRTLKAFMLDNFIAFRRFFLKRNKNVFIVMGIMIWRGEEKRG